MRGPVTIALILLIFFGVGAVLRRRSSNEPPVYDEFRFWGDEE